MSATTITTHQTHHTHHTPVAARIDVRPSTRTLLAAGAVAGPLFIAVATAQVLTRDGFDLGRHPLSLLALGDMGWVQISNFVVAGLLMIAFASGVRRRLPDGRGATWIPRLVTGFGVGLISSGIFVADPENAFPLGTPGGPATVISWHGIAHGAGAALAFDSLIAACVLLAVRFKAEGRRTTALASVAVAVVLLVVPMPVSADGISIRLAVAALVAFTATTVAALVLRRQAVDVTRHEG